MYHIYAIYNSKAGKLYIGQTEDLKERLRLHNEKIFKVYTSRFNGEWIIIYTEEHPDRKITLARERQLKSYRGREFVKKHIPG